ncbi:MAG: hypothetical protein AB1938_28545 [Myxococcota bacterium]
MSADAFLRTWGAITGDVSALVDTALDVEPPGGCDDAWAAWLSRCRVTPLDDDARLADFSGAGQTKGAALSEVRACLDALAHEATARLAPLRSSLSPPQAALVDAALRDFASTALEHYRRLATEKKKRMFGHAKKVAAQHRYAQHAQAKGYVLGCGSCGAPRLSDTFTCAFCGAEL